MKLLELEIHNVRGIRELIITPDGNNFVIWGPNGSGKSAVVDSLDFLLTGEITRLTGRGTRGISLKNHGPHIDCDPGDAWVRGRFQFHNIGEPIEIRRCLETPNIIEYDKKFAEQIMPTLDLAKREQHVLTRRDILRYITSEASTRAQDIQELLNITEIGKLRSAYRRTINILEKEKEAIELVVETAKGTINATTQLDDYSTEKILDFININRKVLDGQPLLEIKASNIKTRLKPPVVKLSEFSVNLSILDRDIENIRKYTTAKIREDVVKNEGELRDLLGIIERDPEMLRDLARFELIDLGMKMIDETQSCPLCDTEWPPGELKGYLDGKQQKGIEARELKSRIEKISSSITRITNIIQPSLAQIISSADALDEKGIVNKLKSWYEKLEDYSVSLASPIESYLPQPYPEKDIHGLLIPTDGIKIIKKIQDKAHEEFPVTTPKQDAWDTLTRLEENVKALEEAYKNYRIAEIPFNRVNLLYATFLETRNQILQDTYDEVRDRFVDIYRQLHGADESSFGATISPTEAGIKFEVDFYGRGSHLPHALHSEGHQDSMGISLWFALSEYLTQGVIDLMILDDVVMSVDTGHRKKTCNLLATEFPDRQFLITTHDRTWVTQLKRGGVVNKSGIQEFYKWHIETGPQTSSQQDMWDRIEKDLTNNVPVAAQTLRRGSEDFFRSVSDALEAKITFKEEYDWELGDYLTAATSRYKDLLKMAKASAQSWGKTELFDMLQETDSVRLQIYKRIEIEKWAVNASVHYNAWTNFSESDFRPVVEAFQDLHGLFYCPTCGNLIKLTKIDNIPQNVRCRCEKINWNLIIKKG